MSKRVTGNSGERHLDLREIDITGEYAGRRVSLAFPVSADRRARKVARYIEMVRTDSRRDRDPLERRLAETRFAVVSAKSQQAQLQKRLAESRRDEAAAVAAIKAAAEAFPRVLAESRSRQSRAGSRGR
jgi:hypothetical protein